MSLSGLPFLRSLMQEAAPEDGRSLYDPDRLRLALTVPAGGEDGATLRKRLAGLLGSDRFALEPLFEAAEPDEPLTYTFAPHGLDRTLPEDVLFAISADLRKALGLVACDPDIGAAVYVEPVPEVPAGTEGVVMDAICWAKGIAPEPKTWALETTRVLQAWALSPGKGQGIIVAQPDTGIADHAEFADTTFDFSKSLNLIEGGKQPTDPLLPSMSNPGHGTGTGSVLASGEGGLMKGAAPKATLVPIRAINDVKIVNAAPVARAIDHAVNVGAHVISMSLGGIPTFALRQAVRRAVRNNVILVAAAGNCIGAVVWPAAYPEMIAVGGTNQKDKKWKGSSHGPAVDISAPAEFVWRADRQKSTAPRDGVVGGQGTSFATALTAGIAALWLGHHGRAQVIAEANRRGISVQALFRTAAQQTARKPPGFPSGLGAGVINAEALLQLPLAGIAAAAPESPLDPDPSGGIEQALTRLFGPGRVDPDFDWDAYGPEVAALALADARAGRSPRGPGREARAFRMASPGLADAAAASRDPRLAQLALRGRPRAPSILIPAPVDEGRVNRVLTGIAATRVPGITAESAAAMDPKVGQARLDPQGRQEFLHPLAERLANSSQTVDLNRLDEGLARLHAEGTSARLDDTVMIQLEALVSLTERPAIAVNWRTTPEGRQVQTIDTDHPDLGQFAGLLALARQDLEDGPLQAVGRIDGDGIHLGTGFVAGQGLVMTNRHVLEEFASPLPRADSPRRWQMVRAATIDFSPSGNDPAQKFAIEEVAFAGPQQISRLPISFDKLDMALLRVQTVNAAGMALPKPFRVNADTAWRGADANLFVVGYPAPPTAVPRDERGAMRHDVVERLRELFGLNYRRKYFSPGLAQSARAWVFDHDATTLGGNSGSVVGHLAGDLPAVGLHFAGDWLRANHAHDLAQVRLTTPGLSVLVP
ncbi:S8/S53 family peptidase [Rhodobacter calidifons]|uniref:S8 family serine peptidase n=1 Tax=Rhodobacter calidifons TaxID=2715277 RepID=A0ABX0G5C0_9RHOB|nr:S8/S53 family peptidase [Rhodobacter calidifons]NHB75991.1 S8 family serine peptidase [Rhodobacter calidifons]